MYILSNTWWEGAVLPLHPAYDILLQEGVGLYRVWIYIVGDVVQEGALWPLQLAVYDILRRDGLREGAGHSI
jgi:hypothetical protein